MAFARPFAALCALVAWIGLGVQLYALLTGPLGPAAGLWRFFAFFTILTNLLVAVLCSAEALRTDSTGPKLRAAAAAAITFVGVFYILVLAAHWKPEGLNLIADQLLHYAAPILYVIYWLVFAPKASLRWTDPFTWMLYPLAYVAYALARGAGDGFYPYEVINVAAHGYQGVLVNAVGLCGAFIALGLLFVAVGRFVGRRPEKAPPAA